MSTHSSFKNTQTILKKINLRKLSHNNPSFKPSHDLITSSNNSQLTSQKNFLNKLLNIIKLSQLDFLSNKSSSKTDSFKNKKLLINLKNELQNILNDNILIKSNIQNEVKLKKKLLQKQIFGEDKNLNNKIKSCNYIININNNNNQINSNYENETKSDTYRNSKILKLKKKLNQEENYDFYFNSQFELQYLKLLNFKIENQINEIDDILCQKTYQLDFIKNTGLPYLNYNVIDCNNKTDIAKANEIHRKNLLKVRKIFTEKVTKRNQINSEIIKMRSQKEQIEHSLFNIVIKGAKKYIDTYEIIDEESLEYAKSCMSSLNNFYKKRNSIPKNNLNSIINIDKINNIININLSTRELSKDKEDDKNSELKNEFILPGNNISEIKFYE